MCAGWNGSDAIHLATIWEIASLLPEHCFFSRDAISPIFAKGIVLWTFLFVDLLVVLLILILVVGSFDLVWRWKQWSSRTSEAWKGLLHSEWFSLLWSSPYGIQLSYLCLWSTRFHQKKLFCWRLDSSWRMAHFDGDKKCEHCAVSFFFHISFSSPAAESVRTKQSLKEYGVFCLSSNSFSFFCCCHNRSSWLDILYRLSCFPVHSSCLLTQCFLSKHRIFFW